MHTLSCKFDLPSLTGMYICTYLVHQQWAYLLRLERAYVILRYDLSYLLKEKRKKFIKLNAVFFSSLPLNLYFWIWNFFVRDRTRDVIMNLVQVVILKLLNQMHIVLCLEAWILFSFWKKRCWNWKYPYRYIHTFFCIKRPTN